MAAALPPPDPIVNKDGVALQAIAKNHLECPVCLDPCRTKPIYQCQNGHTLCNRCIRHLHNCPLCRAVLGREKIRNRALETLLDHVEVPCPNFEKGCNALLVSANIKNHLMNCQYGKFIICPSLGFEDCKVELCYENLEQHMSTVHKVLSYKGGTSPCASYRITYHDFLSTKTLKETTTLTWTPLLITAFTDTGPFILYCELDTMRNCTAKFTVVHTGQPTNDLEALEEWSGSGSSNMHATHWVEISITDCSNYYLKLPVSQIMWRGKTVSYQEMKHGYAKGTFKLSMDQFLHDEEMVAPIVRQDLPQPNAAQGPDPPQALGNAVNNAVVVEGGGGGNPQRDENTPPPENPPPRPPVNKNRIVRRNLIISLKFGKTENDLVKRPENEAIGYMDIKTYTAGIPAATFRAKCSQCWDSLRGTRYRCLECQSFDLCHKCMDGGAHAHHYFALLRDTEQNARMTRNFKRIYREGPECPDGTPTPNVPKRQKKTTIRMPQPQPAAAVPPQGGNLLNSGPFVAATGVLPPPIQPHTAAGTPIHAIAAYLRDMRPRAALAPPC